MAAAAAASSSSAAAKPIGKYDYGLNKKPTARTRVVTKAKLDRMVYAVLSAQMGMDWNGYKDFELARAQRLDASTGLQEYLQPSHQEDEPLNASAIYDQEGSAQRIRVQFGVREQLVEGLVKKLHPEFGVVGIHKITLEPTLDLDRPIDLDWSNHSIARVASRLLPKEYGMGTLHAIKVWEILIGITPTFEQRKKFLRAIAAENRRRDGGRDWSDAGREAFANVPNGVGRYMEYKRIKQPHSKKQQWGIFLYPRTLLVWLGRTTRAESSTRMVRVATAATWRMRRKRKHREQLLQHQRPTSNGAEAPTNARCSHSRIQFPRSLFEYCLAL
jgi:hypothetical protein